MTPFDQGRLAGSSGQPADNNPYPADTREHLDWYVGWTQGRMDKQIGPDNSFSWRFK